MYPRGERPGARLPADWRDGRGWVGSVGLVSLLQVGGVLSLLPDGWEGEKDRDVGGVAPGPGSLGMKHGESAGQGDVGVL